MSLLPATFYIGKPENSTNDVPVPLSYRGNPCIVPKNHIWIVTHILAFHSGDDGTLPGQLSIGWAPVDEIGSWTLTQWKENGIYRARSFRAGLLEPIPPLRLPIAAGWQLAAAQVPGSTSTPMTVFITGSDHTV